VLLSRTGECAHRPGIGINSYDANPEEAEAGNVLLGTVCQWHREHDRCAIGERAILQSLVERSLPMLNLHLEGP